MAITAGFEARFSQFLSLFCKTVLRRPSPLCPLPAKHLQQRNSCTKIIPTTTTSLRSGPLNQAVSNRRFVNRRFRNLMTRDVGTSVSACHPNVATYPIATHCIFFYWRKERSHLDGEHSRTCQHLSSFNCENRLLTNRLLDTAWLNWLNAILSLLHPLDRCRTRSAIGSAIGRPYLALSRIHAQVGVLNQPRSKPLRGLNRAIVVL